MKDIYCGNKCYFCSYEERKIAHRMDGKKHKPFKMMGIVEYEEELKTGEYITVCFKCHMHIHWCMSVLKLSWKEIVKLFNK